MTKALTTFTRLRKKQVETMKKKKKIKSNNIVDSSVS